MLQALSPPSLEPRPRNERSPCHEGPSHCNRTGAPIAPARGSLSPAAEIRGSQDNVYIHMYMFFSHQVVSNSFATPWTVACQVPLSMGFPRQEDWSGLPFPPPGNLPNPEFEPKSPALQADSFTTEPPEKPEIIHVINMFKDTATCL